MDTHAKYIVDCNEDDMIWIVDVGHEHGRSVTNDAEAVVYEIVNTYGDKRIMYQDSMGSWDELVHEGDQFTRFAPGFAPE